MIGYGVGFVGEGCLYSFMSTYFVLFLTNCVGMNPGLAGTISSVALFVEFIMGMIIGNLSDNCTSKLGRRGPFVLFGAVTMPVVMIFVTHCIEGSIWIKCLYYLFFSILFRMIFSCYEIPFNALGGEIAKEYDERIRLRTFSRIFGIIGNGTGYIAPLLILEFYKDNQEKGWQFIGIIFAVICFLSWIFTFVKTKKEAMCISKENIAKKSNIVRNIIKNYLELCKLKSMRILIVYKAAFSCGYALYNVGTLYFLQYSVGIGNKYSSYIYGLTVLLFAVMTPVVNKMALKVGKAGQQKIMFLGGGIVGLVLYLSGANSLLAGVLYMGSFAMVQTSFWQLSNSIFYDIVEVDEFVNNQRREGDIMSLVSVLGTLLTAIMVQVFGIMLEFTGFNPNLQIQPDRVVSFLNVAYMLVPTLCFFVAYIALKTFPINKKTFESLQAALRLREKGEDYTAYMDDIHKIID